MTTETLDNILEDARKLATELVHCPTVAVRDVGRGHGASSELTPPKEPGVYIFREGQSIRWVGESRDLRRRICTYHITTASAHNSNAIDFRDKLAHERSFLDQEGLPDRSAVRKLMNESYSVVWAVIQAPEMRALIEKLVLAWARAGNQPLLNDPKGH